MTRHSIKRKRSRGPRFQAIRLSKELQRELYERHGDEIETSEDISRLLLTQFDRTDHATKTSRELRWRVLELLRILDIEVVGFGNAYDEDGQEWFWYNAQTTRVAGPFISRDEAAKHAILTLRGNEDDSATLIKRIDQATQVCRRYRASLQPIDP